MDVLSEKRVFLAESRTIVKQRGKGREYLQEKQPGKGPGNFPRETARERTRELSKRNSQGEAQVSLQESVQVRCVMKKERWRGTHRKTGVARKAKGRTTVGRQDEGNKKKEEWTRRRERKKQRRRDTKRKGEGTDKW